MRLALSILLLLTTGAQAQTALQHLQAETPPSFKPGHTLPPLSRWGYSLSTALNVEFAAKWGYAVELGEMSAAGLAQMADSNCVPGQLAAIVAADPNFLAAVQVDRPKYLAAFKAAHPEMFLATAATVWSPLATANDGYVAEGNAIIAQMVSTRALLGGKKLTVILNGGEVGLAYDAALLADNDANVAFYAWQGGDANLGWLDYVSNRKGIQEGIVSDAIAAGEPNRRLYNYYFTVPYNFNTAWGWQSRPWFEDMKAAGDYPCTQFYYREFNEGWVPNWDNKGWDGATVDGPQFEYSLIEQATLAAAVAAKNSKPLSYHWVSAGWNMLYPAADKGESDPNHYGDLDLYRGFLKCLYMTGSLGHVAGFFSPPPYATSGDAGATAPHWLRQMMEVGRVHGAFSWLEDYLRTGTLLSPDFVVTEANKSTERLVLYGPHGYYTRQPVYLTSDGNIPGGLGAGVYFACRVDANTITLHATLAQAESNTSPVNLTNGGDGNIIIHAAHIRASSRYTDPATPYMLPALEFPVANTTADGNSVNYRTGGTQVYNRTNTHVLVRKLATSYLVCAWSADGIERDVTVSIPGLGNATVRATNRGRLYTTTNGTNFTRLREDGKPIPAQYGIAR